MESRYLWMLLDNGKSRSSEIRDQLSGVSERMLAKQLGELEEDKLINRIVHPEVPPRVEYELTEFGCSMESMLERMSDCGEMHREKVKGQAQDLASLIATVLYQLRIV